MTFGSPDHLGQYLVLDLSKFLQYSTITFTDVDDLAVFTGGILGMFDGDEDSYYQFTKQCSTSKYGDMQLDFDLRKIYKIAIANAHVLFSRSNIGMRMVATVEYSADGTTWTTMDTETFVTSVGTNSRVVSSVNGNFSARYFRITMKELTWAPHIVTCRIYDFIVSVQAF